MFSNFFHKYPYTNFHELNLDWLLEKVAEIERSLNELWDKFTRHKNAKVDSSDPLTPHGLKYDEATRKWKYTRADDTIYEQYMNKCLQTRGTSTVDPMSQNAVTNELHTIDQRDDGQDEAINDNAQAISDNADAIANNTTAINNGDDALQAHIDGQLWASSGPVIHGVRIQQGGYYNVAENFGASSAKYPNGPAIRLYAADVGSTLQRVLCTRLGFSNCVQNVSKAKNEDVGISAFSAESFKKVNSDSQYNPVILLKPATATTLGGIKVGENLAIDENGVLSATGGGGGETIAKNIVNNVKCVPSGLRWVETDFFRGLPLEQETPPIYLYNGVWSDGDTLYIDSYTRTWQELLHYKYNKTSATWEPYTPNIELASAFGNVWTDGADLYYSVVTAVVPGMTVGNYRYNFTSKEWDPVTISGCTQFNGVDVWTNGTDIFLSRGSEQGQYVWDRASLTWNVKTWTFPDSEYWLSGSMVFSNGKNFYTLQTTVTDTGDVIFMRKLDGDTWRVFEMPTPEDFKPIGTFSTSNVFTDGIKLYASCLQYHDSPPGTGYPLTTWELDLDAKTWTEVDLPGRPNGTQFVPARLTEYMPIGDTCYWFDYDDAAGRKVYKLAHINGYGGGDFKPEAFHSVTN